jgi:hypothetical protein
MTSMDRGPLLALRNAAPGQTRRANVRLALALAALALAGYAGIFFYYVWL